jgi:gamma-glutamyl:cysteine ligase YbdK (ATP-grasp superfamily)
MPPDVHRPAFAPAQKGIARLADVIDVRGRERPQS